MVRAQPQPPAAIAAHHDYPTGHFVSGAAAAAADAALGVLLARQSSSLYRARSYRKALPVCLRGEGLQIARPFISLAQVICTDTAAPCLL